MAKARTVSADLFDSEKVLLTPEMAMSMLEYNKLNRPLNDQHVKRIAGQIVNGKWRFNGDTIKVSEDGGILDGQHRLWAVIESKTPVETIVVRGIARDAFSTIDTIRKPRSGGDTLSLLGASRHRNIITGALSWYLRWQRRTLESYRAPSNKIENSDLEAAYLANPNISKAVENAMRIRRLANPSVIGFLYYVVSSRNPALAERMIAVLENPAGVSTSDPIFMLRAHFTAGYDPKKKDPVHSIALCIKAMNAAHAGLELKHLKWQSQGTAGEPFPKLNIQGDEQREAA